MTTRPRTQPPEVRREQLLDAAEGLFLTHGVAATSVDDIVAGADIAKGTFYLHFGSKAALIAALRERYLLRFCAAIATATDDCPANDWYGRLHAWVEAAVNQHFATSDLHDVVFHDTPVTGRHMRRDHPLVDHLAKLLGAGSEAATWHVRDAQLLAVMLFNATHGALDDASGAGSNVDRHELIANVYELFCASVAYRS